MIVFVFLVSLLLSTSIEAGQAGYSLFAGPYTSIACTIRAPAAAVAPTESQGAISAWCGTGDHSGVNLIQAGLKACAQQTGGAICNAGKQNYAWWEIYPAPEQDLDSTSFPVSAGDTIVWTLTCTLPCTANTSQTWTLAATNLQKGWNFSTSQSANGSLSDANWIAESPFTAGPTELPTANFGTLKWINSKANGALVTLTGAGSYSGCCGQTVSTSAPDSSGAGFSNCFGLSPSFTTCPAPVNGLAFDSGNGINQ